jgi:hypothetical protein
MSKTTEQLQTMIDSLEGLKADAAKHDEGQKAAGTRIRQAMQGIKANAQTIRQTVLTAQKG